MNPVERLPSRYKPYLWVVGEGLESLPIGELVQQRYRIEAPCLWLDTQPEQRPDAPDTLPDGATPYLKMHDHRLHVPGLYGVLERTMATPILLLDNAPIHPQSGELFPDIETGLYGAPPRRQINWLWQMWELWDTLGQYGVATSLLTPANIRVEGWRIRLRELRTDDIPPALEDLAQTWRSLLAPLHISVAKPLTALLDHIEAGAADPDILSSGLNDILLAQTAAVPARITLAGATTTGPTQPRNEDACWPLGTEAEAASVGKIKLGIVCDGVGGHEGGEVASQLAVQSLRIQIQALLAETEKESRVLPPQVFKQQLEAIIRIVNELINFQNDNQGRVGRQRMGTTLALAVAIPQRVKTESGWERVHEVYLAHVGDSRAYWITPDYCHLLTVDDDIAGREVKAGRQTWPLAQERSDAKALTQALGTRGSDHLHPHIQRLVLDETGILLLCSDGLTDNHRIEEAWANYIGLIVKDIVTLDSAVASWVELANQKNGHDNTAVVIMQHKLLVPTAASADRVETEADTAREERAATTGAKLYGESPSPEEVATGTADTPVRRGLPVWLLVTSGLALLLAIVGWFFILRSPRPSSPPPPALPSEEPPAPSP